MTRALIVVDVQKDFCEGGSLAVTGGNDVAGQIGEVLTRLRSGDENAPRWSHVVATKDHHVDPGNHWSQTPDFADSWPVHCAVGTPGEEFHPALDPAHFDAVFRKGSHAAAYSGFEGHDDADVPLAEWLRQRGVTAVDICGIATDHCVRATALDAVAHGFPTRVRLALCAGVAPESTRAALEAMDAAGVRID